MNLKQALYIKTIAETGSITQAAKQLYISQPSLSQMLKQVEEEIGLKLFERSTSPFRPTYAGERYLQVANMMLTANEALEVELEAIKHEDSGRLRFGMSVSRGIQLLPDLLPRFHAMYPHVTLELMEAGSADLEEKLLSHEIDLAFAVIDSTLPNLHYELLEKEVIGILAGERAALTKKFSPGTPLTIEDLKGTPFVYLKEGHSTRVIQNRLFRNADFEPEVLLETDSLNLALMTVLKSDACMVLSDIYNNSVAKHFNSAFYPLKGLENRRHFYACYRLEDYQPKYVRDFIDLLQKVIEEQQDQ